LSAKEIKITIDNLLKNEFKNIESEVITGLADINRECDYNLCIVDAPKKTENILKFHGIKKNTFCSQDFFLSKNT